MKTLPLLAALAATLPFPSPARADAPEDWNVHAQTTLIAQAHPAFPARFSGPHSLSATAESEWSWTATGYLGLRLGEGTALYVDPEAAAGEPMSDLLGLAGFPDGELAKGSGRAPVVYDARTFLRHVTDLGGETSALPSAANQLAGHQSAHRLTWTAGTMSVLDVFDANDLADDPRSRFMNWDFLAQAAWDYPADARGYTAGLAMEYVDAGWALRAGRFAVPRVPDQSRLDPRIGRHHGDVLEIERDYAVGGQSGALRLLATRLRATLATYADALARSDLTGSPPDLAAVRHADHAKTGVGLDLEHHLSDDLGVFVRAMRSDGRTETDAFTEADRSWSAGTVVGGARWGRPADACGLAVGEDGLSGLHRGYLARGGLTVFLGDGALAYRPEAVAEGFYSATLGAGVTLAADLQRLSHPGHDAARGPVTVYGLRLHWER